MLSKKELEKIKKDDLENEAFKKKKLQFIKLKEEAHNKLTLIKSKGLSEENLIEVVNSILDRLGIQNDKK